MSKIILYLFFIVGTIFILPNERIHQYAPIALGDINTEKNDFGAKFKDSSFYLIKEVYTLNGRPRAWQNYDEHYIYYYSLNTLEVTKPKKIFNDKLVKYIYDYIEKDGYEFRIYKNKILNQVDKSLKDLPLLSSSYSIEIENDYLYYSDNLDWQKDEIQYKDLDILSYDLKDTLYPIPHKLSMINTDCDEAYISFNADKVFFSRRCNEEDFDIYEYNTKTAKTTKLPAPINSAADDIFYQEHEGGYSLLSSNRKGGKGKFDVYLYKKH